MRQYLYHKQYNIYSNLRLNTSIYSYISKIYRWDVQEILGKYYCKLDTFYCKLPVSAELDAEDIDPLITCSVFTWFRKYYL